MESVTLWNESVANEMVSKAIDAMKGIWYAKNDQLGPKELTLKAQLKRGMDMMWTRYHVRGEPALRVVIAQPLASSMLGYFGVPNTNEALSQALDAIIDPETANTIERQYQKNPNARGGNLQAF